MAKIAILGDLHFGVRNDNPFVLKHQQRFFDNVFFPYMKEHEIKELVQVGDTFDRRKYINFLTLHNAKSFYFDKLKKQRIKVHQIVGNHDVYFKNTNQVNSPELLLKEYSNIHVYTEATDAVIAGTRFCMIPWIHNGNYQEAITHMTLSPAKVCFGHFEIAGFEMYAGFMNEGGMETDIFSNFDLTITGHFHLRTHKYGISYIGTPYDFMWEDYGQEKGFHIFDTETNEMTFVRNPYQILKKIVYHNDFDIDAVTKEEYDETYVKVIVREKDDHKHFNKLQDKLYSFNLCDVEFMDFETEQADDTIQVEGNAYDFRSTSEILSAHVDEMETPLDKGILKEKLKQIYIEAINQDE
jgi:DNA repair exonuclease SbcCD nuclease subunit